MDHIISYTFLILFQLNFYRRVTNCVDINVMDEQYMSTWTAAARGRGLSNQALADAFEIVLEYY